MRDPDSLALVVLACRIVLAFVFAISGIAKLVDRKASRQAMADFGVPMPLVTPIAALLPIAELFVVTLLCPARSAWYGAVAALSLLVTFTIAIAINLGRGRRPECHCFGQVLSKPIGPATLLRNAALTAGAGLIVWTQPREAALSATDWIVALARTRPLGVVVVSVFAAVVVLQTFVIIELFRQHGRLLVRIDALEQRLGSTGTVAITAASAPTPRVGAPAPEFQAVTPGGSRSGLKELLEERRPLLLIFSSPKCHVCVEMVPAIRRWQQDHGHRVTIALISTSDDASNGNGIKYRGLENVLLQEGNEVAQSYGIHGTPAALVVEPDGTVGSHVAQGADAIAALVAGEAELHGKAAWQVSA